MKSKNISWLIYVSFVLLAIFINSEHPFMSFGPHSYGKYLMWLLFLVFSAYTYHCSSHESLFKTIKTMNGLYWGRQIGIDLYLGLFMFIAFVFFHQQTVLVSLLWIIPILIFGNLATLLYLALHYDSIVFLIFGIE